MDPKILVLDEPAAGLDPRGKTEILGRLVDFQKKRQNTLLIISHSMEDIALYSDHIITLSNGKVLIEGTPKEVFAQNQLLCSNGLAIPQVTQILSRLKSDGYDVDDGCFTLEEAAKMLLQKIK